MNYKFIFLTFFIVLSFGARENKLDIFYYNSIYGNIHQNKSDYSSSITTISCGQPLKIKNNNQQAKWLHVQSGPYKGYIKSNYVSREEPICFQDKYPKFFESLNIDISDIYYWGRLYDLYLTNKQVSL